MTSLRDPESGCPWDLEQDFASIAPFTVEEAYEVADAIAREDFEALRFDYYGAPGEQDVRRWRRSWPNQASRYPELIRVSAERRGARAWPQLVVALRSTPAEELL